MWPCLLHAGEAVDCESERQGFLEAGRHPAVLAALRPHCVTPGSPGSRCSSSLSVPTGKSPPPLKLPSITPAGLAQLNLGCTCEKCLHPLRGRSSRQPRHALVSSLVAGWPAGRLISSSSGLSFFAQLLSRAPPHQREPRPPLLVCVAFLCVFTVPISGYWIIPFSVILDWICGP